MTTIEDFFGSIGRRRPKAAVPPYPHAEPVTGSDPRSPSKFRRFIVRVAVVLLLLLLVFFARFIPESWNPFGANSLFSSNAANGSSGNGPAAMAGATSSAVPQVGGAGNGNGGAGGSQGPRGADGKTGGDGKNGVNGTPGADGKDGAAGPMGPAGSLGQADSDISACDDNIVVGLRSAWSASNSDFRVSRIILSDVSNACSGLYLGLDLLDASGASLAHVEISSISVSSGSVTLTAADFSSLALVRSVDVARVALEIAS